MVAAQVMIYFCDLCVYGGRGRPGRGLRQCQTCGAHICDEHTHVYGATPQCILCQKRTEEEGG